MELYYSEAVKRLPSYQPNDRKRKVAEARPTRADAGSARGRLRLLLLQRHPEDHPHTFDRWMEILKRTPGSVLWLLDRQSPRPTPACATQAEAARRRPQRLIFAPKQQNADHMARYPLADLFLDTAPYGAHTTASDALWMAVPVLTWSGRGFASRVCGSLVRSAGLPELVVDTPRPMSRRP
jgi:predicted O-linked N-acetylglucosamine transferase (SPINDLY family)